MRGTLDFLAEGGGYPVYFASSAGRDAHYEVDREMITSEIEFEDARSVQDDAPKVMGLHPRGFDLLAHQSEVPDFHQLDKYRALYESEIEALLKSITGCRRVEIFDHTVRATDPNTREKLGLREQASMVHNDYSEKSGFVCLEENLAEEARALRQARFQIINVWRPLVDPVTEYPLVFCDVRTLQRDHVLAAERRAPTHTGEIQLVVFDESQRWYYFSEMNPSEVLVFKTFDSIQGGSTLCTAHSAAKLSSPPANARPRESIETRAFVFF